MDANFATATSKKKPVRTKFKKNCWRGKAPPDPLITHPRTTPRDLGAAAPRPPLGKKRDGRRPGTAVGPSDGRPTTVRRPSDDRPTTVRNLPFWTRGSGIFSEKGLDLSRGLYDAWRPKQRRKNKILQIGFLVKFGSVGSIIRSIRSITCRWAMVDRPVGHLGKER